MRRAFDIRSAASDRTAAQRVSDSFKTEHAGIDMTRKLTGATQGGALPGHRSPALDERLQAHIGRQLKSMYDEYLNEPVPDHLIELLDKLDRIEAGAKKADGEPA